MLNTNEFAGTPTRKTVETLEVGDLAPSCFGLRVVTEITGRGVDTEGRAFVCYYVEFGPNGSTISGSMKEDTIERTVALTRDYSSAEITDVENRLRLERTAS